MLAKKFANTASKPGSSGVGIGVATGVGTGVIVALQLVLVLVPALALRHQDSRSSRSDRCPQASRLYPNSPRRRSHVVLLLCLLFILTVCWDETKNLFTASITI